MFQRALASENWPPLVSSLLSAIRTAAWPLWDEPYHRATGKSPHHPQAPAAQRTTTHYEPLVQNAKLLANHLWRGQPNSDVKAHYLWMVQRWPGQLSCSDKYHLENNAHLDGSQNGREALQPNLQSLQWAGGFGWKGGGVGGLSMSQSALHIDNVLEAGAGQMHRVELICSNVAILQQTCFRCWLQKEHKHF